MSGNRGGAKLCIETARPGEGRCLQPAIGAKHGDRAIIRPAKGFRVCGFRVCGDGNARQSKARSASHPACRRPKGRRLARRQENSHNSINLFGSGEIFRIAAGGASADPSRCAAPYALCKGGHAGGSEQDCSGDSGLAPLGGLSKFIAPNRYGDQCGTSWHRRCRDTIRTLFALDRCTALSSSCLSS